MKKALLIFILSFASSAFATDVVDKITTPGQAFIAELSLRTGIKISNATYGPAKDIRMTSVANRLKGVTMQDIHFQSEGKDYVCRIKIHDSENFFLVGCKDSNNQALHRKTGSVLAGFFERPILDVQFPTGRKAEFESPMGVATTRLNLRYLMNVENERTGNGAH